METIEDTIGNPPRKRIRTEVGRYTVSTVELWASYPFGWETLVLIGSNDYDGDRYTTEADARAGHAAMVAKWIGKTA